MNVNAFLAIGAVLAVILPVVIVLMENEVKNAPPKPVAKVRGNRGKRNKKGAFEKWVDERQPSGRQNDFATGYMRSHGIATYVADEDGKDPFYL